MATELFPPTPSSCLGIDDKKKRKEHIVHSEIFLDIGRIRTQAATRNFYNIITIEYLFFLIVLFFSILNNSEYQDMNALYTHPHTHPKMMRLEKC
jgi:hypothetical protein